MTNLQRKKGLISIIGAIILLLLVISIPATVYLVRQQQDNRSKAAQSGDGGGGGSCGECQRLETKQECHNENKIVCLEYKDGTDCQDEEYPCQKSTCVKREQENCRSEEYPCSKEVCVASIEQCETKTRRCKVDVDENNNPVFDDCPYEDCQQICTTSEQQPDTCTREKCSDGQCIGYKMEDSTCTRPKCNQVCAREETQTEPACNMVSSCVSANEGGGCFGGGVCQSGNCDIQITDITVAPAGDITTTPAPETPTPEQTITPAPVCTTGETECNDSGSVNYCDNGQWRSRPPQDGENCNTTPTPAVNTTTPAQNTSTPECTNEKPECNSSGTVNYCDNGQWRSRPASPDECDKQTPTPDQCQECYDKGEDCVDGNCVTKKLPYCSDANNTGCATQGKTCSPDIWGGFCGGVTLPPTTPVANLLDCAAHPCKGPQPGDGKDESWECSPNSQQGECTWQQKTDTASRHCPGNNCDKCGCDNWWGTGCQAACDSKQNYACCQNRDLISGSGVPCGLVAKICSSGQVDETSSCVNGIQTIKKSCNNGCFETVNYIKCGDVGWVASGINLGNVVTYYAQQGCKKYLNDARYNTCLEEEKQKLTAFLKEQSVIAHEYCLTIPSGEPFEDCYQRVFGQVVWSDLANFKVKINPQTGKAIYPVELIKQTCETNKVSGLISIGLEYFDCKTGEEVAPSVYTEIARQRQQIEKINLWCGENYSRQEEVDSCIRIFTTKVYEGQNFTGGATILAPLTALTYYKPKDCKDYFPGPDGYYSCLDGNKKAISRELDSACRQPDGTYFNYQFCTQILTQAGKDCSYLSEGSGAGYDECYKRELLKIKTANNDELVRQNREVAKINSLCRDEGGRGDWCKSYYEQKIQDGYNIDLTTRSAVLDIKVIQAKCPGSQEYILFQGDTNVYKCSSGLALDPDLREKYYANLKIDDICSQVTGIQPTSDGYFNCDKKSPATEDELMAGATKYCVAIGVTKEKVNDCAVRLAQQMANGEPLSAGTEPLTFLRSVGAQTPICDPDGSLRVVYGDGSSAKASCQTGSVCLAGSCIEEAVAKKAQEGCPEVAGPAVDPNNPCYLTYKRQDTDYRLGEFVNEIAREIGFANQQKLLIALKDAGYTADDLKGDAYKKFLESGINKNGYNLTRSSDGFSIILRGGVSPDNRRTLFDGDFSPSPDKKTAPGALSDYAKLRQARFNGTTPDLLTEEKGDKIQQWLYNTNERRLGAIVLASNPANKEETFTVGDLIRMPIFLPLNFADAVVSFPGDYKCIAITGMACDGEPFALIRLPKYQRDAMAAGQAPPLKLAFDIFNGIPTFVAQSFLSGTFRLGAGWALAMRADWAQMTDPKYEANRSTTLNAFFNPSLITPDDIKNLKSHDQITQDVINSDPGLRYDRELAYRGAMAQTTVDVPELGGTVSYAELEKYPELFARYYNPAKIQAKANELFGSNAAITKGVIESVVFVSSFVGMKVPAGLPGISIPGVSSAIKAYELAGPKIAQMARAPLGKVGEFLLPGMKAGVPVASGLSENLAVGALSKLPGPAKFAIDYAGNALARGVHATPLATGMGVAQIAQDIVSANTICGQLKATYGFDCSQRDQIAGSNLPQNVKDQYASIQEMTSVPALLGSGAALAAEWIKFPMLYGPLADLPFSAMRAAVANPNNASKASPRELSPKLDVTTNGGYRGVDLKVGGPEFMEQIGKESIKGPRDGYAVFVNFVVDKTSGKIIYIGNYSSVDLPKNKNYLEGMFHIEGDVKNLTYKVVDVSKEAATLPNIKSWVGKNITPSTLGPGAAARGEVDFRKGLSDEAISLPELKIIKVVESMEKYFAAENQPKDLNCRGVFCGSGATQSVYYAEILGGTGKEYQVNKIQKQLRGVGAGDSFQHEFSIIEFNGKKFLVDGTFNQFMDNTTKKIMVREFAGDIITDNITNKLAQELLKNGYVEFTDANFREYLRITSRLGVGKDVQKITAAMLDKVKPTSDEFTQKEIINYFKPYAPRKTNLAPGAAARGEVDLRKGLSNEAISLIDYLPVDGKPDILRLNKVPDRQAAVNYIDSLLKYNLDGKYKDYLFRVRDSLQMTTGQVIDAMGGAHSVNVDKNGIIIATRQIIRAEIDGKSEYYYYSLSDKAWRKLYGITRDASGAVRFFKPSKATNENILNLPPWVEKEIVRQTQNIGFKQAADVGTQVLVAARGFGIETNYNVMEAGWQNDRKSIVTWESQEGTRKITLQNGRTANGPFSFDFNKPVDSYYDPAGRVLKVVYTEGNSVVVFSYRPNASSDYRRVVSAPGNGAMKVGDVAYVDFAIYAKDGAPLNSRFSFNNGRHPNLYWEIGVRQFIESSTGQLLVGLDGKPKVASKDLPKVVDQIRKINQPAPRGAREQLTTGFREMGLGVQGFFQRFFAVFSGGRKVNNAVPAKPMPVPTTRRPDINATTVVSDPGGRSQEDFFATPVTKEISGVKQAVFGKLYAVADGVGGQAKGEVASKMIIDGLNSYAGLYTYFYSESFHPGENPGQRLRWAVVEANNNVWKFTSMEKNKGMATTLVAAVQVGNTIYIVNVGDSRGYHIVGNNVIQITKDQENTNVNSSDKGKLTSVIGSKRFIDASDVDLFSVVGGKVLLATDGLFSRYVAPENFFKRTPAGYILRTPQELIDLAKQEAKRMKEDTVMDNVTVLIIQTGT